MKFTGLDFDPSKIKESVTVKPQIQIESATAFRESTRQLAESSYLLPRIEAIHAGATRNSTRYPAEKLRGHEELKSGVYSWLHPYAKPVIYNHDTETEATGRIQTAAFAEYTSAGRPGIIVVPKITSEKAIDDILGGRLLTVSIGATTDAAICSVCGTNILDEGYCGHMKGETYDGVTAEWIVGNVWFDELSWVNVPADQDAMIIDSGQVIPTAESFAYNGQEVINLGLNTTEWLVSKEKALKEGLVTKEGKGDSTLTEEQIKALQTELEEAKAAKESAEQELNTVKEEKEALETELTETKETLSTTETELNSVKEELATKTTEVEELTSTKESLEAEKAALETSVAEEKEGREQAVAENANLATQIHTMTAERVVDLRISLGKESDREEAITKYASRSVESLKDSLSDLLTEAATATTTAATQTPAARVVEPVTNPVGGNTESTTKQPEITAEDALLGLFRGPAFRK